MKLYSIDPLPSSFKMQLSDIFYAERIWVSDKADEFTNKLGWESLARTTMSMAVKLCDDFTLEGWMRLRKLRNQECLRFPRFFLRFRKPCSCLNIEKLRKLLHIFRKIAKCSMNLRIDSYKCWDDRMTNFIPLKSHISIGTIFMIIDLATFRIM